MKFNHFLSASLFLLTSLISCGNSTKETETYSTSDDRSEYQEAIEDKNDNRRGHRFNQGKDDFADEFLDTQKPSQGANAKKLRISNINDGQSPLWDQAGNSYHAINMFDGNKSTGWAIKLSQAVVEDDLMWGPLMNINAKKVDHISILNGYGKNKDSFQKNTRARWILIYRVPKDDMFEYPDVDDIIYEGPLKDTMSMQTLQTSPSYDNSKPTGLVQIAFKPYYPEERNGGGGYYVGSKWDDLVISEMEFYGIPK